MASVVAPNDSPAGILRSLRGSITDAYRAYPDVLHVEIRDPQGGLWRLATQDAEWFPGDPAKLLGLGIEGASLDEGSGELRLGLSGGSLLRVVPAAQEAEDDPPNWKLFKPEGVVLVFGPGGRWQFRRADDPVGLPTAKEATGESLPGSVSEALGLSYQEGSGRSPISQLAQILVEERAQIRNEHLLVVIAFGLSILSVAVAAASLALALH